MKYDDVLVPTIDSSFDLKRNYAGWVCQIVFKDRPYCEAVYVSDQLADRLELCVTENTTVLVDSASIVSIDRLYTDHG